MHSADLIKLSLTNFLITVFFIKELLSGINFPDLYGFYSKYAMIVLL